MPASSHPLHLHIENSAALGPVFEITQDRVSDAIGSFPDIEKNVRITIGGVDSTFQDAISTADVLFGWDFDRASLSDRAPRLRLIQLQGAGVNHLLPLDWVPDGVSVTNSRGAHGRRAGEYLIMAVLALNNALPQILDNQRRRRWETKYTSTVSGKTLLVFGVGHVGGDTAALARHFGMTTIGVRRSGEPHPSIDLMHRPQDLHAILPDADFVLITAPHTPATDKVFGAREFALMKPGAGFVNYSRAGLVDYRALRETLEAGRINAIVDVFDEEPLPSTSPLWDIPNLIITPHSSSNDPVHHARRSLELLFENVGRFMAGKTLKNVVDREHLY